MRNAQAPLTLRYPRFTLAAALFGVAALGLLGSSLESRLVPTSLSVPGTASAEGTALLKSHFGDSAPFAILLRGPAAQLNRQGPRLIRALRADDPGVTTLSPWEGRTLSGLRPAPNKALVIADFHVDAASAVADAVPGLDATLERVIRPPVRANQTGYASLSRAIQESSIASTERAEAIAIPFLLLVLLLVFRSPIAALIPLGFGAVTVIEARGVLELLSSRLQIDAFAVTVATMMGLALGVDYALLMVSRFREELAAGRTSAEAALATRCSAGRTTLFAGTTLIASMVVSIFVLPGSLLLSLAGTAILVTAISLLTAIFLTPPLLSLLGPNLDRWRIGSPAGGDGKHALLDRLLAAALRRPGAVAVASSAALLLLAAPALAIKTGPPSASQLPTSDPARTDSELISAELGPGWDAPFVIVAAAPHGPITSKQDLARLASFQRRLDRQSGVRTVIGPGEIARRAASLQGRGRALLGPPGERRLARLQRLGPQLGRAGAGIARLRGGLSEAAAGANLLGQGSGRAQRGAQRIADGLERTAAGGSRADAAIERLATGSTRLAEGQQSARASSLSLVYGLHDLLPQLRKGSLARARQLRGELSALAESDPRLKPSVRRAKSLVLAIAAARTEVRSLRSTAARLRSGITRLAAGSERVARGTRRLAAASSRLGSGLERLAAGSGALSSGLARLRAGSQSLASGLSSGYVRAAPLQSGLRRAAGDIGAQADRISRQRDELMSASPHLFDSGYFVLSALDGAEGARRARAAQAIDLANAGQAAAILVIGRYGFNTPGSEDLYRHLGGLTSELARTSGMEVGIAGGAAQLTDYNHATRTRVPLVILAMAIVTFLALSVLLRAPLLALVAVVLNLMTVGVAFGVVVLLFDVPSGWPLGGHDYVDAVGAAGIFGIVFGLSVDYAIFLLARMREAYVSGGDHREAVADGLRRTARVITGAAAIMIAVFACFAAAPISTVSQLGIALAVAVALDATVVRILLLPALMLLIGERVWWLPKPLERILPRFDPQITGGRG